MKHGETYHDDTFLFLIMYAAALVQRSSKLLYMCGKIVVL